METIIKTTLIGLFFGTFGTTLGGIIGVKLKRTSNKFLSFILSFAITTPVFINNKTKAKIRQKLFFIFATPHGYYINIFAFVK